MIRLELYMIKRVGFIIIDGETFTFEPEDGDQFSEFNLAIKAMIQTALDHTPNTIHYNPTIEYHIMNRIITGLEGVLTVKIAETPKIHDEGHTKVLF